MGSDQILVVKFGEDSSIVVHVTTSLGDLISENLQNLQTPLER